MDKKLAVLIDSDNVPSKYLESMMEEINKYGNPIIKRIYGDWTKPYIKKWKDLISENAIAPVQQYAYTAGKNATDSALIIDAMDLLYSRDLDGFCIVSSDSDFTKLALRLKESGKDVYGFGEQKTPVPFMAACNKFIYLENLIPIEEKVTSKKRTTKSKIVKLNTKDLRFITNAIKDISDDEGWSFLGEIGNLLQKRRPNFDARNYGYSNLSSLLKSIENIEIETRKNESGTSNLIYAKVS